LNAFRDSFHSACEELFHTGKKEEGKEKTHGKKGKKEKGKKNSVAQASISPRSPSGIGLCSSKMRSKREKEIIRREGKRGKEKEGRPGGMRGAHPSCLSSNSVSIGPLPNLLGLPQRRGEGGKKKTKKREKKKKERETAFSPLLAQKRSRISLGLQLQSAARNPSWKQISGRGKGGKKEKAEKKEKRVPRPR